MLNSLSQLVLKIAAPGVPDFYQGTEFWDLSLVDPDNRRPVDFAARKQCLSQLEPVLADSCSFEEKARKLAEMLSAWQDARIKMYLTTAGLRLRKQFPQLFLEGAYLPLVAEGEKKDHVVSFARMHGGHAVVAVVPRLVGGLAGTTEQLPLGTEIWEDTAVQLPPELAGKTWTNVFTGEILRPSDSSPTPQFSVADIMRVCPVALLHSEI